jgi:arylsulfatase A-like enzyme
MLPLFDPCPSEKTMSLGQFLCNQRLWKRWVSVVLIGVFSGSLAFAGAAGKEGSVSRPNILLLLSDDHSYPYVGAYGSSNVRTPVLDRLAAEGMRFERFFTGAPQCVPSRACLMTGRSAVAARMTRFSAPLPRNEVTLPEWLRSGAGYYTGICGRSFHLDGASRNSPALSAIYERHGLRTFAERVDFLNTCGDAEVPGQVRAFLEARPMDRPFFLWANFSDPHHPWEVPAEFRPDPATLELPGHWPDLPGMREQLADYFGEINRLDRTVGRVLSVLEEFGVDGNTIVVFCGDNGAALPHGKGSLYDPGSNVPFLIRWPGVIAPGGVSRQLLSGEDLAPTLLAAADLQPGSAMSGISFLPLLRGEVQTPREFVFIERGSHGSNAPVRVDIASSSYDLSRAIRSDRWKLIYNCTPWVRYSPVDSAGGAGWKQLTAAHESGVLDPALSRTYFTSPRPVYELYDLDADPAELQNLSGAAEHIGVERRLREALAEKMILDFDYLPLPSLLEGESGRAGGGAGKRRVD